MLYFFGGKFMYSIVIPCYKSAHTISDVVNLTAKEMNSLGKTPFEFILVDDCSPDDGETIGALKSLSDKYPFVTTIELAVNSGQHNAIMAGMNYAEGDVIIGMDDDMQTHPSQLGKLFEEFDKGYDIVYGYYPEKKHSGFRNFGSKVNFWTVRVLIGKPKDLKTSSYWIARKFVRDYAIQYRGKYTHLQGVFLRITRNISSVPIKHFERAYGKSGYTLKKLIGLWGNVMGFSIVPLRIATRLGATFSMVGLVSAIIVLLRRLLTTYTAAGWASIMCAIFFFSGMIMMSLGLIGEYVGRLFLTMSNNPQFVVRNIYKQEDNNMCPENSNKKGN